MPRKPREKSRTGIYHVMLRGINQQTIFEDPEDKRQFLTTLTHYKNHFHFKLYGYCIMDNHVHLLFEEGMEPFSLTLKRISSSYVYWYNRKYARVGHLFQARFLSECVHDHEYFLTVIRYIHQNPLKAGLVQNVWKSEWTSLQAYLGHSAPVDIGKGLTLYSSDYSTALIRYISHMEEQNDDHCLEMVQDKRISDHEVRECMVKLGVPHSTMLQQMGREERNRILAQLKKLDGVTYRQLSRVTGISKSVIGRVRLGT
ncbi:MULTISPECIES: transposase [Pontibacillus]|uniref:Transposase n=1 Tax=Pontibacillus chungwhensis TaxID=265426 RepID=A0ABY8UZA8_9BACI|nr:MULTISPECIES: transposase [Pontibacillus]MCD5324225.1 transposase [Pontibacillus sp. HN14]WIF97719.1 transposase [Pontibacillus chungwhensis]